MHVHAVSPAFGLAPVKAGGAILKEFLRLIEFLDGLIAAPLDTGVEGGKALVAFA